jgi:hypothetical protein
VVSESCANGFGLQLWIDERGASGFVPEVQIQKLILENFSKTGLAERLAFAFARVSLHTQVVRRHHPDARGEEMGFWGEQQAPQNYIAMSQNVANKQELPLPTADGLSQVVTEWLFELRESAARIKAAVTGECESEPKQDRAAAQSLLGRLAVIRDLVSDTQCHLNRVEQALGCRTPETRRIG